MKKERFIEEVSKKILAEKCDLFVGSGISSESGMPSWEELLSPLAEGMGISLTKEDDLPMIAQYIVNNNSGNKNIIYNRIIECYGKGYAVNKYHNAISNMSVNTVWTTNYDELLEKCFVMRKPKVVRSNEDLSKPALKREFEIIKLHGCIKGKLEDIVLTQQEYDEYLFNKVAIAQRLRDSFIQKSFLFIGYGYRDPYIRNIMIESTKQSNKYSQDHYIILFKISRKPDEFEKEFEQRKIRFDLWIKELNRIGIRELVVNDSDELEEVLRNIAVKSRGKSVFVSGSHENDETGIYGEYGKRLAKLNDVVVINGQNQGIGIKVVNGFMETAVNSKKELADIIKFFPNPYAANPDYSNKESLLPQLKSARTALFVSTQLFVVFAGGMGTEAEFEVAKEKGCSILIAIANEKDFENPLIKKLLKDDYCSVSMKKVPEYNEKISAGIVPTLEELVDATEVLING